MFIIKHYRKDRIDSKISYDYGTCYLCKCNGSHGDSSDKPLYALCHNYKPVYFKLKWHAFMYLSRYCGDNNADEYQVIAVNDKMTPECEVFDPTTWGFTEPDEYYQDLHQYCCRLNELFNNVEDVLLRYDNLDSIVKKLVKSLQSEFYNRPDKFCNMWLNTHVFDLRRNSRSRKLFAEIFQLAEKRKEELNAIKEAKVD